MRSVTLTADVLRQAQAEGIHGADLARRFGVTRTAVFYAQRRHGIQLPLGCIDRSINPRAERDAKIKEAYAAGLTQAVIADQFGLTSGRISQICSTAPTSGVVA